MLIVSSRLSRTSPRFSTLQMVQDIFPNCCLVFSAPVYAKFPDTSIGSIVIGSQFKVLELNIV